MNRSNNGLLKFIGMVEKFFPAPKFNGDENEEALWLKMMQEMLGGYDEMTLVQAAQTIVRHRDPKKDGTFFPKPSECIAACEAVIKLQRGAMLQIEAPKADEWSDDRITLAFDLANGPLGRRAAREGWVNALLRFCRKNMRLPKDGEISACISENAEFQEALRRCREGECGPLSASLAVLGESIAARSEENAKRVLGDAA